VTLNIYKRIQGTKYILKNTKNESRGSETGGIPFSPFKKNFEDLKCAWKVLSVPACLSQIAYWRRKQSFCYSVMDSEAGQLEGSQ